MKRHLIFVAVVGVSCYWSFLEAREESGMGKESLLYQVTKLTESIEIDGNWNKPVAALHIAFYKPTA